MALLDTLPIQTDLNSLLIAGDINTSITFKVTKCPGNWEIEKIVHGGNIPVVSGTFSKMSGKQGDSITYTHPNKFEVASFYIKSGNGKLMIYVVSRDNMVEAKNPRVEGYYYGDDRAIVGEDYGYIFRADRDVSLTDYSKEISEVQAFIAKAYSSPSQYEEYNRDQYLMIIAKFPPGNAYGSVTTNGYNKSRVATLVRDSMRVSPNPLVFDSSGSKKTLDISTNIQNYTVEWSKNSFHHNYENYPSTVPTLVETAFGIDIKLPETTYSYFGTGEILIKASDGKELLRVPVYQNGVHTKTPSPSQILLENSGNPLSYDIPITGKPKLTKIYNGEEIPIGSTFTVDWATIKTEWITYPNRWDSVLRVTYSTTRNPKPTIREIRNAFWIYDLGDNVWDTSGSSASGRSGTSIQIRQKAYSEFTIEPAELSIGANGGTLKSHITTNHTGFVVRSQPTWVTDVKYTRDSSGPVTITVDPNPSDVPRTDVIDFANDLDRNLGRITITQEGQDIVFEVDPPNIEAPKEGGDYTVTVNTNVPYKWKSNDNTTESGDTWFTVQQANAINTIPFNVHVAPNLSAKKYTGTIVFTPTGRGSKTVTITSAPSAPKITYTPASSEITKDSNTVKVIRKHNLPSISEFENLVGISYTKRELSPYPNTITEYTIKATENTSASDRISFLETSGSGVKATYTLTQRSNIVFDVEQMSKPVRELYFKKDVSSSTVDVRYNVGWTLSNFASLPFWIKISGAVSITNDPDETRIQTQIIKVAANTGDARTFTLVYTSARGGTVRVVVSQEAGIVPIITVNPTSIELENTEQEFDLTVSATHNWKASNIPDWIQLSSISGSAGITTLRVKVRMNMLLQRSNTLIFSLDKYPNFATCKVVQEGLENGYDITDVESDSDWGPRQETRIRDKYLKVKVRYTGNEKAIITAIKTLYTLTHA